MPFDLIIGSDDEGRRLDRVVRKALDKLPLSALHRLFRKKKILLDGVPAQVSDRARSGSRLTLLVDGDASLQRTAAPGAGTVGTDHPRPEIIWEGAGLLIVNKPVGLAVHGPDSLEDRVRAYLAPALAPSLSFRPGPLHRLDQPTSGIVVYSREIGGARVFSAALRDRRLRKRYLALLDGDLALPDRWEDQLIRDQDRGLSRFAAGTDPAGKRAGTRVYPLARCATHTLALAEIETGRTHQIRSQAAGHGHPLAGDRKYGGSDQREGLLLHAYELVFPFDFALEVPPVILAPLPGPFLRRIRELFGEKKAACLRDSPPTDTLLGAIL
jgi:23S rRNA pseudouridine955/2504/2580 synthase